MKTKVIFQAYDPTTGISCVTIANMYGEFTGYAGPVANSDERQGIHYAKLKAYRKYYKERVRILNSQIKAVKTLMTMQEQTKEIEYSEKACRQTRKYYWMLCDELDSFLIRIIDINDIFEDRDYGDED